MLVLVLVLVELVVMGAGVLVEVGVVDEEEGGGKTRVGSPVMVSQMVVQPQVSSDSATLLLWKTSWAWRWLMALAPVAKAAMAAAAIPPFMMNNKSVLAGKILECRIYDYYCSREKRMPAKRVKR